MPKFQQLYKYLGGTARGYILEGGAHRTVCSVSTFLGTWFQNFVLFVSCIDMVVKGGEAKQPETLMGQRSDHEWHLVRTTFRQLPISFIYSPFPVTNNMRVCVIVPLVFYLSVCIFIMAFLPTDGGTGR